MNTSPTVPPIPPEMLQASGNIKRIPFTLAAAGIIAWLGDFLFWKHAPGISFALYACVVAAAVIATHRKQWGNIRIRVAAVLMLAASFATALEISFTNVSVLLALFAVICGECWYGEMPGGWARWSESVINWFAAPGRWPWLAGLLKRMQLVAVMFSEETGGKASRFLQILVPALCLTAVFGIAFAYGNAVFGDMVQRIANQIETWISQIDFSIGHLAFWLFLTTLALAWMHPRPAPLHSRAWTRTPPQISRKDAMVAVWQSRLVLVALNALFFMVNTIDVFYLWNRMKLPEGVNFSEFVHEGVFSLTIAVLLSALVIAVIFQQEAAVRSGGFLKGCAQLWIVQNMVLIAGVFLRLKLYVLAYQLSEQRVYVGCFLLLVVTGFILLSWHVARDGRINSLIFRNAAATFTLFFILQFANVAGWVAHHNVARWEQEPKRTLDLGYLVSLGPDAWPALVEAASVNNESRDASIQARVILRKLAKKEILHLQDADWRSWQARRDGKSQWLVEQSMKLPPPNGSLAEQDDSEPRSFFRSE